MKTPAPQRAAGRQKLAKAGNALADGSFPVPDLAYLRKAIRSVGRAPASKRPALKALIRRRARELGAMNAPGVKGTWAFANDGGSVIDMASGPAPYTRHADENVQCPSCKKYNAADARYCDQCGVKLPASAYEMSNTEGDVIDMATMTRMPKVRGSADVQLSRSGPGSVTVMHKSTGMKVGSISKGAAGWQATHATGAKGEPTPTMASSLSGLIGMHNKMAAGQPSSVAMAGDGAAVSLATSAATSSDGPRITGMSGGKPVKGAAPAMAMSAEVAKVYAKLIKKGLSPKQAAAFAKRAAAMHAKDAAPKASAA